MKFFDCSALARQLRRDLMNRYAKLLGCMGLVTLSASPCFAEEKSWQVPNALVGHWIEQLSRREYGMGCKPARLVISQTSITEHVKVCGRETDRSFRCEIRDVAESKSWFLDKRKFALICSPPGTGLEYSYEFGMVESFGSVIVEVMGPANKGHRVLGEFTRP